MATSLLSFSFMRYARFFQKLLLEFFPKKSKPGKINRSLNKNVILMQSGSTIIEPFLMNI